MNQVNAIACCVGVALSLTLVAGPAAAADLRHRMPECTPFAQREQATPDSDLGRHAKISWYGDSRTVSACVDKTDPVSNEPVWSTLKQTVPMLASAGRSYKQRAMNGTSLREMVAGKDGLNKPWPQQVAADASDVVVIAFGTNDASGDVQAKRSQGLAEFEASLDSVVRVARQAGKKVLLVQPYKGCDYKINEDDAAHPVLPPPDVLLAPYAEAVGRVGAARQVEVARVFALPARCEGPDAGNDMPDGLHATQAYTRRIADVIGKALKRVIDGGG
jgi:lysophospholipase L1-like esterase